ncbi:hypothetical protein FRC17_005622 [Serendipita sp. 399]|nr:hypothetical protein FRC17_005622 [Serendipita sp. 399]
MTIDSRARKWLPPGGLVDAQLNDISFSNTGVPIPEVERGSDGIEDFKSLLDTNYDHNRLAQGPRNTRQKTPNGASKSANYQSERAADEFSERDYLNFDFDPLVENAIGPVPRSKPTAAMGPRSLRGTDADYAPLSSPKTVAARLDQPATLLSSALRARSPYDPTSLQYSAGRSSQGFGALSRYQDEQVDPETVMEEYIDYDGGLNADQDSPSPPPVVRSSPPQVSRKSLPSPTLSRARKSVAPPTEEEKEDEQNQGSSPSVPRHVKGKQRAMEERENPVTPSTKRLGRNEPVDDDEPVREDTPVNASRKSRGRLSGDSDHYRGSDNDVQHQSGDEGPQDEIEVPPGDYDYGEQMGDDDDAAPADHVEEEEHEEPPVSRSEHSEAESEAAAPRKGKKQSKKGKERDPEETRKKRTREDDEDAPKQRKKPKSTTSKPASRAKSKTPAPDEESWIEPLVSPSEDEEEDEGVRRSRRARIAPVKFWLGEKLEYDPWRPGSNRQVPTIIGVRRVPEQTVSLVRRKRRPQQKGRSKSRRLDSEEPPLSRNQSVVPIEDGWDAETESTGVVLDWDTKEEIEKLIVYTSNQVEPQWTDKKDFRYQRLFTEEKFVAAGEVIIPPHGTKPKKSAKDNTYIFYLIEGAIHVIVHEAKFYLATGGMFLVPRGNTYYIRNMRDYPAKLFFVQGRMMTEEDLETASAPGTTRESLVPFNKSRHVMEDYAGHRRSASRSVFDSSSPHKSRAGSRPMTVASNANGRRR